MSGSNSRPVVFQTFVGRKEEQTSRRNDDKTTSTKVGFTVQVSSYDGRNKTSRTESSSSQSTNENKNPETVKKISRLFEKNIAEKEMKSKNGNWAQRAQKELLATSEIFDRIKTFEGKNHKSSEKVREGSGSKIEKLRAEDIKTSLPNSSPLEGRKKSLSTSSEQKNITEPKRFDNAKKNEHNSGETSNPEKTGNPDTETVENITKTTNNGVQKNQTNKELSLIDSTENTFVKDSKFQKENKENTVNKERINIKMVINSFQNHIEKQSDLKRKPVSKIPETHPKEKKENNIYRMDLNKGHKLIIEEKSKTEVGNTPETSKHDGASDRLESITDHNKISEPTKNYFIQTELSERTEPENPINPNIFISLKTRKKAYEYQLNNSLDNNKKHVSRPIQKLKSTPAEGVPEHKSSGNANTEKGIAKNSPIVQSSKTLIEDKSSYKTSSNEPKKSMKKDKNVPPPLIITKKLQNNTKPTEMSNSAKASKEENFVTENDVPLSPERKTPKSKVHEKKNPNLSFTQELQKRVSKIIIPDENIIETEPTEIETAKQEESFPSENELKHYVTNKKYPRSSHNPVPPTPPPSPPSGSIQDSESKDKIFSYKIGQKIREDIDDWVTVDEVEVKTREEQLENDPITANRLNNKSPTTLGMSASADDRKKINKFHVKKVPENETPNVIKKDFRYKIGLKSEEEQNFEKGWESVGDITFKSLQNENGMEDGAKNIKDQNQNYVGTHHEIDSFISRHVEKMHQQKTKNHNEGIKPKMTAKGTNSLSHSNEDASILNHNPKGNIPDPDYD